MKNFAFRTVPALACAILLAACGSGNQADPTTRTAALVATVPAANMPVPDCAADNCRGLRIIDANAEAYRHDAAVRAADPQS